MTNPVCLGVMCPQHHLCARYAAVDFSPPTVQRIYFCPGHSSMFVPLSEPEVAQPGELT